MISFIWHSGNGKSAMQVKVSDFRALGVGGEGYMDEEQGIILGQWY